MTNLDPAERGYVETALWSWCDLLGLDAVAPDALATLRADVAEFCEANADDVAAYLAVRSAEDLGDDLWLTRNGHDTGFWDVGLGELGERLAASARQLGERVIYLDRSAGEPVVCAAPLGTPWGALDHSPYREPVLAI